VIRFNTIRFYHFGSGLLFWATLYFDANGIERIIVVVLSVYFLLHFSEPIFMSLNVMSTDHALTLLVGLCANAKIAGKGMRATHNESVLG